KAGGEGRVLEIVGPTQNLYECGRRGQSPGNRGANPELSPGNRGANAEIVRVSPCRYHASLTLVALFVPSSDGKKQEGGREGRVQTIGGPAQNLPYLPHVECHSPSRDPFLTILDEGGNPLEGRKQDSSSGYWAGGERTARKLLGTGNRLVKPR
ncbi:hypothetical protein B0H14DRAFT_2883610, partial [Mycena olivaceomarginata]